MDSGVDFSTFSLTTAISNSSHAISGSIDPLSDNVRYGLVLLDFCMNALALLLNIFTAIILARYKFDSLHCTFHILIALEICQNLARAVSTLFYIQPVNRKIMFPIAFTVTQLSLSQRNYWIGVMSIGRSISVYRPFQLTRILTVSRYVKGLVIIIFLSAAFSTTNSIIMFYKRDPKSAQMIVLIFQIVIPVSVVLMSSLFLIAAIFQISKSYISRSVLRAATLTTLLLTSSFALCQLPSIVHEVYMMQFAVSEENSWYWNEICNLLTDIDSIANFFIFICNSKNFTRAFVDIFFRMRCCQSSIDTASNGMFQSRKSTCLNRFPARFPSHRQSGIFSTNTSEPYHTRRSSTFTMPNGEIRRMSEFESTENEIIFSLINKKKRQHRLFSLSGAEKSLPLHDPVSKRRHFSRFFRKSSSSKSDSPIIATNHHIHPQLVEDQSTINEMDETSLPNN